MLALIPGRVVAPLAGVSETRALALVDEPMCILHCNVELDLLVLIAIAARESMGRRYFTGPVRRSYAQVQALLDPARPQLVTRDMVLRPETLLTDDDLRKKYPRKDEQEPVALTTITLRWRMIQPLVDDADKELLFDVSTRNVLVAARAQEIVNDPELRSALTSAVRAGKAKRGHKVDTSPAALKGRVSRELLRLLNQFWAGGSVRGALVGFTPRCGSRGKPRRAGQVKRGAPNRATRSGKLDQQGLNVEQDSEHAKIIKFAFDTWVVRGTTVSAALHQMWDDFYSVVVQQPDGSTKREWLPHWQRPTRSQFEYWGQKESPGMTAWRRQLPPDKFDRSYRALIGAATDDVYGVGQRGAIDSTPPDLHLVRAVDRLARVGGAHRIIVVDSMFGYIPGLYMGFEPPSSTTVRLALFNAWDPDKAAWLTDLGLDELPAEDFIPMWFSNLMADNTDLRSAEIMACGNCINTNIHFIPKRRSDRNPLAEAGHHTLHRLVDHRLAGTTFGQPTQRGEVPATDRARYTMMEAIREVVRAIYVHNTAELQDNRPLRLRLNGVAPTRVAMTREYIRLGKVARALHAVDFARRHLLPRHPGTFTAQGVRLHRRLDSTKVEFIGHIAYVSDHPILTRWCEEARRGGKLDPDYFRADFIVNPYRPRHIWYLDLATGEIIELSIKVLKIPDSDLLYVATLQDMIERDGIEGSEAAALLDARERKQGAMQAQQRASNNAVEQAYQAASRAAGGEPSKRAIRANRRDNRDAEKAGTILGVPLPDELGSPAYLLQSGAPATPLLRGEDRAAPDSATGSASAAPSPSITQPDRPQAPAEPEPVRTPRNSLLTAAIAGLSDKS